jgi:transcription antitermination factor NusG
MPPGTADAHIAILACKAGREFHVRDQVRAFGVQCYLPKYLVNLRREGMVARSLFGCYMFVWMTDEWRQLIQLIHVKGFVRRGKDIIEVPPRVIAELRAREGPTGYVRLDGRFFIGQQVRVTASGLAGVYAGLSADYKARVLFAMLGRDVEMAVHDDELTVA